MHLRIKQLSGIKFVNKFEHRSTCGDLRIILVETVKKSNNILKNCELTHNETCYNKAIRIIKDFSGPSIEKNDNIE